MKHGEKNMLDSNGTAAHFTYKQQLKVLHIIFKTLNNKSNIRHQKHKVKEHKQFLKMKRGREIEKTYMDF